MLTMGLAFYLYYNKYFTNKQIFLHITILTGVFSNPNFTKVKKNITCRLFFLIWEGEEGIFLVYKFDQNKVHQNISF